MADQGEALFYNALNTHLDGSYAKLAQLKNKFRTWKEAWRSLEISKDPSPIKDMEIILLEDENYPIALREIPHPPFGIYLKGKLPTSTDICIAIVGTRKVTEEGKRTGKEFGENIAKSGVVVISGLAFGLDKSAHEGALLVGGKTIAVLANGLNSVYPKTNETLAKNILNSGGALISEYYPEATPLPFRFLERNRIVSGLSKGIVVIEAPEASGSLATARFALDQNRDVFVVPGPIRHPNYRGSHNLIRYGATLVTKPEEVLQEYGLDGIEGQLTLPLASSEEKIILDVLRSAGRPLTPDEIISRTNLDIQTVNKALSFLLISSKARESGAGYYI